MSWDKLIKSREESGQSNHLKFKDGDSYEGIFRGEPHIFYATFKDPKEYPEWAEGRSFKFKINFIIRENGKPVARIFKGGAKVRDALIDAQSEYGLDCVFKIKRTGSTKEDTRYSILFKAKLEGDQIEQINEVPLNKLGSDDSQSEPPQEQHFVPDGDIPF